jgi:hypothetical protein
MNYGSKVVLVALQPPFSVNPCGQGIEPPPTGGFPEMEYSMPNLAHLFGMSIFQDNIPFHNKSFSFSSGTNIT